MLRPPRLSCLLLCGVALAGGEATASGRMRSARAEPVRKALATVRV
ncbi:MAG TPA: hypothetical protein VFZ65_02085 [Planctomycetota bacterium]|nr:hypothetical protein [Planctomycetota bacterium]